MVYDGRVWAPRSQKGLLSHFTGICSCGTGEDFSAMWDVLEYAVFDHNGGSTYEGPLKERRCFTSPLHELAAKMLDLSDLVEHGSSIGHCWATEKGMRLYEFAKDLPWESEEFAPEPDLSRILDEEE